MSDVMDFLLNRRSVLARNMTEPGPDDETLRTMLRVALRIPDHSRLYPWRFLVIRGAARETLGGILVDAFKAANPEAPDAQVRMERERFTRAPVVVAVVSRVVEHAKIPEWEQILSSGACCMNLLNAAHAAGFGAQWITEWYAYDERVKAALGLGPGERIAGFVYIGTPVEPPTERKRAEIEDVLQEWTGPIGTAGS